MTTFGLSPPPQITHFCFTCIVLDHKFNKSKSLVGFQIFEILRQLPVPVLFVSVLFGSLDATLEQNFVKIIRVNFEKIKILSFFYGGYHVLGQQSNVHMKRHHSRCPII